MDSSRKPFLSMAERMESGHVETLTPRTKIEKILTRARFISFYIIVYFFAAWGVAALLFQIMQRIFIHHSIYKVPDVYHPDTLKPGLNLCDCGNSIHDALAMDCVYDTLSAAWLPPYCRDVNLTKEFDLAGPEPDGEWKYFADEEGTVPLNYSEIAALGDTGGTFWTSREWHIVHCLFMWQKYIRMRETGLVMEKRFDSIDHVKHCSKLIRNPTPDHFFLIEVPVKMNSSND